MVTAVIAFGMVLASELYEYKQRPRPSRILKLVGIWAVLGWVADFGAPELALAFAVGIILTMLFTYLADGRFLFASVPNVGKTAERLPSK